MEKKQILWFVLLAVGGSLLLSQYLGNKHPVAPPAASQPPAGGGTPASGADKWLLGDGQPIDEARPVSAILGSLDPDPAGDYRLQVELDPRGAAVYTVKLAGDYDTADHKRKKDKTPKELQDWSYSLLNPVSQPGQLELPLATRKLEISSVRQVDGKPQFAPLVGVNTFSSRGGQVGWRAGQVTTAPDGTQSVEFSLTVYRIAGPKPATASAPVPESGPASATRPASEPALTVEAPPAAEAQSEPLVRLVKTYSLKKHSNSLSVALRLENLSPSETLGLGVLQYGPTGMPAEQLTDDRKLSFGRYTASGKKVEVPRVIEKSAISKAGAPREEVLGDNRGADPVLWGAIESRFFAAVLYPLPPGLDPQTVTKATAPTALATPAADPGWTFKLSRRSIPESPESLAQLVTYQSDARTVAPGASVEFRFDLYCGLKSRDIFATVPLYDRLQYRDLISFGSCTWCTFQFLALWVMWLIETVGGWMGNYGIVIILLVLVVRLLLHPITKKSQVSMMKLGKLGPEMEKIKAKFKDDKNAQQREMMQFMKHQGASPILGCLPMLLQMPIWIALWGGLNAEVALRHASFLPFWITDLSGPDAVITWKSHPVSIPLLSGMMGPLVSLNILPILLGVFMFLQQKLTPMSTAATMSADQKKQQKIMMYVMTAMFLFMFYNQPSGLTLYIMASTAGGVVESWVIRKHIREKDALQAATETRVDMPGKGSRGQRPKKPKGPFRLWR